MAQKIDLQCDHLGHARRELCTFCHSPACVPLGTEQSTRDSSAEEAVANVARNATVTAFDVVLALAVRNTVLANSLACLSANTRACSSMSWRSIVICASVSKNPSAILHGLELHYLRILRSNHKSDYAHPNKARGEGRFESDHCSQNSEGNNSAVRRSSRTL